MPIYFFWNGLIYRAVATYEQRNGVNGYTVTFNGRTRRFLPTERGWSCLPWEGMPPELKNRIGHAITFYNKLK